MAVALQTRDTCGYQPSPTIVHRKLHPFFSFPHGHSEIIDYLMQRWGETTQNLSFAMYLWCICYEKCPTVSQAHGCKCHPITGSSAHRPSLLGNYPLITVFSFPGLPPCTPQPHPGHFAIIRNDGGAAECQNPHFPVICTAAEQPELKPLWLGDCAARHSIIVLAAHQDDGGERRCPLRWPRETQSCAGPKKARWGFPIPGEACGQGTGSLCQQDRPGATETFQTHSTPRGFPDCVGAPRRQPHPPQPGRRSPKGKNLI